MIEVIKNNQSQYCFVIKSESGHTLLSSIHFSNRNEALEVAEGLQRLKSASPIFERKTNHNGQFLFHIKNENGKLMGSSQLYNSEAGMENGIKNLINRIDTIYSSKQL